MKPKKKLPPDAEHHCYVIRIYQRDTGLWHSTVTKDAMQEFDSRDVPLKSEAIELAALYLESTK